MDRTNEESALQENIRLKGKNSYYYAHQKKEGDSDIPKWDGAEAPRLLQTNSENKTEIPPRPITQYAWSDAKSKISIYITLEDIGLHPESQILLSHEESSLKLVIESYKDQNWILSIPALYENIVEASFKQKSDKIIVILKKVDEISWHSLKK